MHGTQGNLEEVNTSMLKRALPAPRTAPTGREPEVFWHSLSAEAVLRELNAQANGLTTTEAVARLDRYGRNEIARRKPVSPLRLLLKQFANFFVLVLLFAAGLAYAVSFLPGQTDRRLTAYFILGIIAISVFLGFFEEFRSQKTLESLDRLLIFKAVVLREGARREVDAAEVVPGDVLVLAQGQKAMRPPWGCNCSCSTRPWPAFSALCHWIGGRGR